MRWFRFAVLLLVATVLQAGLVDVVAVTHFNIRPDLLLILLTFFAVHYGTAEAIITSFTIGFAADIIGPAMGPQTVGFGLLGTLLAYLHRVVTIRKTLHQSLAIFFVSLLAGTLAHLLSFLKDSSAISGIYTILFGTSLYSAIVGPFLFLPCVWWMRIKTYRFSRH
jgi:rod shape-determining protein MreD